MQTPALMLSSYRTQRSLFCLSSTCRREAEPAVGIVGENLAHSNGLLAGGHHPHAVPWKQGTVAALVSMSLRRLGTVCGAGWNVDFR